MTLQYRQQGDYLIPNLTLPQAPQIGKYGMLRHTYLRNHREPKFTALLMTDQLSSHLEQIDQQANQMMEQLILQMKKEQKVTEQLKADNQMLWVQMMNDIRNQAEEIVLKELIYA